MDVSLFIKLIDQVSQPATKVRNAFKSMGEAAAGMQQGFKQSFQNLNLEAYNKSIAQAEQNLGRAKSRLVGAAGIALVLVAPLKAMGNFEERLIDFGNVAGIFGEDLAGIETRMRELGPTVNKTAGEMLSALEILVGKGLSPDVAMAALEAVGMSSTATKADIEAMATSAFSVLDNLQVPASQLQLAFDAMAQAGKTGGFELKGMAQYFPGLTASARALKMEGVPAVAELSAALQIAMKGSNAGEGGAATNLQNFLSKLTSRETRANLEKLGIDLEEEFQKAADSGVSSFEHMIGVINEVTDGGNVTKLSDLFGDQQVLAFLKPMLANLDEYAEIRDAALSADGVNQADFENVTEGFNSQIKALTVQLGNLVAAGGPLLEVSKDIAAELIIIVTQINAFTSANPELTKNVVLGTAALMAMNVAMRLVKFGMAAVRLPVLALGKTFLMFNSEGKNVAIGWRILAGTGKFLGGAFGLIASAGGAVLTFLGGLSAPVWIVVGALVAAGFAIWKYWDRISSFISGLFGPLLDVGKGVMDAVGGAIDFILNKVLELTGIDPEGAKAAMAAFFDFSGLIDGAIVMLDEFWAWLGSFFSQEKLSDEQKAEVSAAGRAISENLINGIKNGAQSLWDWFAQWPQMILDYIGNIDLGAIFQWPSPPDWLSFIPGFGGDDHPPALPPMQGPPMPQNMKTTISASVTDSRPPNVTVHAPITVHEATNAATTAQQIDQQLGNAINQARAGALHEGGE